MAPGSAKDSGPRAISLIWPSDSLWPCLQTAKTKYAKYNQIHESSRSAGLGSTLAANERESTQWSLLHELWEHDPDPDTN